MKKSLLNLMLLTSTSLLGLSGCIPEEMQPALETDFWTEKVNDCAEAQNSGFAKIFAKDAEGELVKLDYNEYDFSPNDMNTKVLKTALINGQDTTFMTYFREYGRYNQDHRKKTGQDAFIREQIFISKAGHTVFQRTDDYKFYESSIEAAESCSVRKELIPGE